MLPPAGEEATKDAVSLMRLRMPKPTRLATIGKAHPSYNRTSLTSLG